MSRRDEAMVTVRFFVGEDLERSLVKVRTKMTENMVNLPPGEISWNVKSVEIDDVPVVTLTFYSPSRTPFELRRIAEEVKARMDSLRDLSLTRIFGGYRREIIIEPDIEGMAARRLTFEDLAAALARNNDFGMVGSVQCDGKNIRLLVEPGLSDLNAVRKTVVGVGASGGLIRLEDVAKVNDGPCELENYARIGFGPAAKVATDLKRRSTPAVTIAFSKKKGTNAVSMAKSVVDAAVRLKGAVIPKDVDFIVTRNYGTTADKKVNNLIMSMIFAIITVVGLITITMG